MKITHLIWALTYGGAETMLIDIINEESKTEEINLILVNKFEHIELIETINKRVTVHLINRKPGSRNFIHFIRLNFLLKRLNPDIIHLHNGDIRNMLLFNKKNIVYTVHAMNVNISGIKRYTTVYAISKAVQTDLAKRLKVKSVVVYNGIPFSSFNFKFGLQKINSHFKIVQISRLFHLNKGQDLAIIALGILKRKYGITNFQLDFIGDGPSLKFLQKLVKENDIEDQIHFKGAKEREYIYQNLYKYDLLIQPSINEGFGLTIIEAMAAKVQVLVADIDGPIEIIQNGKYGNYFQKGNAKQLAESIKDIIQSTDYYKLVRKLENAYQYAKQNFDISITAKKYIEDYKRIISNNKRLGKQ
jgi:glycosyltransferase involved in cell wall biosynthesis